MAHPPLPLCDADLARLRPYLPPRRLDSLPPAPRWTPEHLAAVQEHLTRLLDVVVTYLPRHLVGALWPSDEREPAPVGGECLDGTLLFADISGFTALSERLSTLGPEGAEQITDLVNRYFSAMLAVIFAHGGDLFKFGGDALLAFIPTAAGGGCVGALLAAWEMQQAMAAFHQVETSLGTFPLRMKIGMHTGSVFAARVGSADGREFIVTGPVVNDTARAESHAVAGQILITDAVLSQVEADRPGFLTVSPGPEGYHVVEHLAPAAVPVNPLPLPTGADLARPGEPPVATLRRSLTALSRLTPYLPFGLLPRLATSPSRHETGGEHRLVTILFANFVGASRLVTRLGREQADEAAVALNDYFTAMQQAVSRYGGVVNKVDLYDHGDKLMVLFGAPVAHEDDTERAVRAALEMQAALPTVDWLQGQRIGVSTGVVFAGHVGAVSRREYTVMGDKVNLAARLMSAAQEGEILLSSFVRRKVSPFFRLQDRSTVHLKGKSRPVPIFAVVGERARPESARGLRGLRSPLVGRDAEQRALHQAVARLRAGEGGIVSLVGEAGLGKSRLMAELRTDAAMDDIYWLEGRCLSYTQQVSYSIFIGLVHSILGVEKTDNPPDIWLKLRRRVAELLPPEVGADVLPYLAHFLALPLSGHDAERVAYLEGETLQRQVVRSVTVLLEYLARDKPLVLAFDDLHWADSASLILLERCLALTERVPVLLFLLYRPEKERGCWQLGLKAAREHPHRYTRILLAPLKRERGQDVQLVRNLLGIDELPPALTQLLSRAEGNPFYVEEIIRMLIDQGVVVQAGDSWRLARDVELEAIPDTLQGLIMARLDRLIEEARRTLQLASVIGRIFRRHVLDWLAAAVALASHLDDNLMTLRQAELVRRRATLPEPEYAFKQTLIREVAYESLLVRDRRVYHHLVAQNLERDYSGARLEEVYELLAHHYSLSDDREKALFYLLKAGDKARMAYANPESLSFYRQAEAVAEELGRVEEQAAAGEGLGDVLFHIGEYDEALTCYRRALWHRTEPRRQADLHRRIAMVYEKQGEYEEALAACQQGIRLLTPDAERSVEMARLLITRARVYQQQGQNDAALQDGLTSLSIVEGTTNYREIAQAHNSLGLSYRTSRPDKAIEHLEKGLATLERIGDEYEAARVYGNLAILYYQKDLNRSESYFRRTLETMQRLGDVWGESQALQNLGIIHYSRGDYSQAIDYYRHSLSIKERLGDSLGIADCHINLGETYRALGDSEQAIVHLEKGLTIAHDIGASQAEAECSRQLAECHLERGELPAALETCNAALAHARRIGDRREEGIIYRVLGSIYLEAGHADLAQEHLKHSVAILRELGQEFDLGQSLCEYARALKRLGRREPAAASLREALSFFERLQLAQEQERVRAALEEL